MHEFPSKVSENTLLVFFPGFSGLPLSFRKYKICNFVCQWIADHWLLLKRMHIHYNGSILCFRRKWLSVSCSKKWI